MGSSLHHEKKTFKTLSYDWYKDKYINIACESIFFSLKVNFFSPCDLERNEKCFPEPLKRSWSPVYLKLALVADTCPNSATFKLSSPELLGYLTSMCFEVGHEREKCRAPPPDSSVFFWIQVKHWVTPGRNCLKRWKGSLVSTSNKGLF